MSEAPDVVLVGASVRSMAESAVRAGFRPRCYDMFGDADLRNLLRSVGGKWSEFVDWSQVFSGHLTKRTPLIVSGGLESSVPRDSDSLFQICCPDSAAVAEISNPAVFFPLLKNAGIEFPVWQRETPPDKSERWLVKTRQTSGGLGVSTWDHSFNNHSPFRYFQHYVPGVPASATFASDGCRSQLLGTSLVLSGCPEIGGTAFQFCGNVAPVGFSKEVQQNIMRAGEEIVRKWKIRGVFGVDFVLTDYGVCILECNPRITASHDLHELSGNGINHIALQAQLYQDPPLMPVVRNQSNGRSPQVRLILWATEDIVVDQRLSEYLLHFPACRDRSVQAGFADIPAVGAEVKAGTPFCSVYISLADAQREQLESLLGPLPFEWDAGQLLQEIQARYQLVCSGF